MFSSLQKLCQRLSDSPTSIEESRKVPLRKLANYLVHHLEKDQTTKVIVICTHNSRRSHMGQLALELAADYYGHPSIETFSGGTEATQFNGNALNALQEEGFKIDSPSKPQKNKKYQITWKEKMSPYIAFSKVYDDLPNPTRDFVAVMVCSEADEACPMVLGASQRISLPYEDPKAFDGSPEVLDKYKETFHQILREMLFVVNQARQKLSL